ncbi:hypothetical protein QR680_007933 [Steinernema hermaphroditum]|uniref:Serpentine receptor class gamma n=1 Tax=Steinernema hermaphroditum TaxID=289476 RepID=A0AA39M6R3_9BILA|nr:hypothetical protein QR680_007933 [Steinernema hermaphroditum]
MIPLHFEIAYLSIGIPSLIFYVIVIVSLLKKSNKETFGLPFYRIFAVICVVDCINYVVNTIIVTVFGKPMMLSSVIAAVMSTFGTCFQLTLNSTAMILLIRRRKKTGASTSGNKVSKVELNLFFLSVAMFLVGLSSTFYNIGAAAIIFMQSAAIVPFVDHYLWVADLNNLSAPYLLFMKWLLWVLALISALSVVAFLVLTLYDIGWTYSYKNHGVHPKKGWEIALLVLSVGISLAGIVIHLLIFLSLRLGSNWRRGHFVIIVFLVFQVYMMARMIILLYVGSRTIAERKGTKADPFAVVLIVFGTLFFINDVISFLFFVTHFRILKQEVHERECEEAAQEDQRSECTSEPGGRSRKATETPFEDDLTSYDVTTYSNDAVRNASEIRWYYPPPPETVLPVTQAPKNEPSEAVISSAAIPKSLTSCPEGNPVATISSLEEPE